jgi:hypothetical protein
MADHRRGREPVARVTAGPPADEASADETPGEAPSTGSEPAAGSAEHDHGLAASARELWHDERVEVVAAVLLSLATVLSAWGAYQATRWSGEQANSYAESTALRAQGGSHGTIASRQIQIDVATFLAWSDAKAQADTRLADFLAQRFRAEFKPAFAAWLANAPSDATGLPAGTPFDQPEYKLAEQAAADAKIAEADAALVDAQTANQTSDDFVLTAVLFASVLFFAGMAARFRPQSIRWAMLGVAVAVFTVGLFVEFSLPQNVGF